MKAPRHIRFLASLGIGVLGGCCCWLAEVPVPLAVLVAGNGCFVIYLTLELALAARLTPQMLRQQAIADDEGVPVMLFLALATVIISLVAIFLVVRSANGWLVMVLALLTIPLGWTVLQTLAAFHYARLYYGSGAPGGAGGISFPGTPEPGITEFAYLAFTIGMTAQVSDTTIETPALRKAVLIHATGSFFFNTCILALAVSTALSVMR